jgi:hypothetical protein
VARVRSRVTTWQICGGQCGTGTGSSPSSSGFHFQHHFTVAIHTHILHGGWIIGPYLAEIQRHLLTSTLKTTLEPEEVSQHSPMLRARRPQFDSRQCRLSLFTTACRLPLRLIQPPIRRVKKSKKVKPSRTRHAGAKKERRTAPTHYGPKYAMGVSGQSDPGCALVLGKGPPVPIGYEAGCTSELVWTRGNIFCQRGDRTPVVQYIIKTSYPSS